MRSTLSRTDAFKIGTMCFVCLRKMSIFRSVAFIYAHTLVRTAEIRNFFRGKNFFQQIGIIFRTILVSFFSVSFILLFLHDTRDR